MDLISLDRPPGTASAIRRKTCSNHFMSALLSPFEDAVATLHDGLLILFCKKIQRVYTIAVCIDGTSSSSSLSLVDLQEATLQADIWDAVRSGSSSATCDGRRIRLVIGRGRFRTPVDFPDLSAAGDGDAYDALRLLGTKAMRSSRELRHDVV